MWKNERKTSEMSFFYVRVNNFAQGAKWSEQISDSREKKKKEKGAKNGERKVRKKGIKEKKEE